MSALRSSAEDGSSVRANREDDIVFVYGSLQHRATQKRAMGRSEHGIPTSVRDVVAVQVPIGHTDYPTLRRAEGRRTEGELLIVTPAELQRLDTWEEKYRRVQVPTEYGRAWAFVLRASERAGTPRA